MKANTAVDQKSLLAKAINLLSYRPRSAAEMRWRGLEAVVPKLIELNLLDDKKFAKWWVDQRLAFRPRGNIALKSELIQKGIDREIIESVLLSKEEEISLAKKLLAKKNLDKPRAQRLLLSRGFSSDIAYSL